MDSLVQKQLINSRSLQYNYYVSPTSNISTSSPTLVLLHGFPDSAAAWHSLVPLLTAVGFRLLIPDLLGYGNTSKPWDPFYFNSRAMASDIMELLDHENIKNFVSIGHDWGSFLAHRLYLWHPDRVDALVVGAYSYDRVVRDPIDIEAQAAEYNRTLGWPVKLYYNFLAGPEAPDLISGHPESFLMSGYGVDNAMNETFGRRDGLRNWLTADKRRALQPWARDLLATQGSPPTVAFRSPLMWYRALVQNAHLEVEKTLPKELDVIRVPFLHIGGVNDPVCPPAIFDNPDLQALWPDFTSKVFNDCGHFLPFEKPVDMAETIIQWLQSKNITSISG
ncbi:epoxide hydrolase [Colletotrichum karsti]|uniref:Epoxide hydrolase n=1 Tax=Colletotrichum karsti TaxID=1095194 RepID=A0A9P6HUR8_9PEZI|nr:epoxide hydrolase [Colletotrichum karsti]KAF9871143.1 epoxide hydrolase [Colletotrichum karsti]